MGYHRRNGAVLSWSGGAEQEDEEKGGEDKKPETPSEVVRRGRQDLPDLLYFIYIVCILLYIIKCPFRFLFIFLNFYSK